MKSPILDTRKKVMSEIIRSYTGGRERVIGEQAYERSQNNSGAASDGE